MELSPFCLYVGSRDGALRSSDLQSHLASRFYILLGML